MMRYNCSVHTSRGCVIQIKSLEISNMKILLFIRARHVIMCTTKHALLLHKPNHSHSPNSYKDKNANMFFPRMIQSVPSFLHKFLVYFQCPKKRHTFFLGTKKCTKHSSLKKPPSAIYIYPNVHEKHQYHVKQRSTMHMNKKKINKMQKNLPNH